MQVLDWFMSSLVGALGTIVGGACFLPSLAAEDITNPTSKVIQGIGHSISGYSSQIFTPSNPLERSPTERGASHGKGTSGPDGLVTADLRTQYSSLERMSNAQGSNVSHKLATASVDEMNDHKDDGISCEEEHEDDYE